MMAGKHKSYSAPGDIDFLAVDVETANADMSSICQIGVACYKDKVPVAEWRSYVDPEDYFSAINISIHGIDELMVAGSPTLPELADQLHEYLDNCVSVCHTHFDRVAISQAFTKYGLTQPSCTWLDSARVARRAWEQFAQRGYGLKNVSEFLGYSFGHHDALEDAKAAGHVFVTAMEQSGLGVDEWLKRVRQPLGSIDGSIKREGNPDGPLYGEVVVFTGSMELPRRQAADKASRIGCQVGSGVTRKTTLLVVGDQDIWKLVGHLKSSKHRKAETLISEGQPIRILREADFNELVRQYDLDVDISPGP